MTKALACNRFINITVVLFVIGLLNLWFFFLHDMKKCHPKSLRQESGKFKRKKLKGHHNRKKIMMLDDINSFLVYENIFIIMFDNNYFMFFYVFYSNMILWKI